MRKESNAVQLFSIPSVFSVQSYYLSTKSLRNRPHWIPHQVNQFVLITTQMIQYSLYLIKIVRE